MSRSPSATARIVIVDDDEYVREVTEMVLTGAGHSVRSTASGLEALRFLEEESCDLVIADLRMPEIDGPTLHREIVARWPHDGPRVLFVSGQGKGRILREMLDPKWLYETTQAADFVHAHADQYGPEMEVYFRTRADAFSASREEGSGDQAR